MREIVLDTETTGLDPAEGHRVVELGCVELEHHVPTGRTLHLYFDPQRDMPEAAFAVHGLSIDFLSKHNPFEAHVDEIQEFLADAPLVIHNAAFDMRFLNAEFRRFARPVLPSSQAIDTLAIARRKFPGAQVSLDALCKRFGIDNSSRTYHGALLDAQLLANVYLELIGGREPGLMLGLEDGAVLAGKDRKRQPQRPVALPPRLTAAEEEAHRAFIAEMGEKALWRGL
ncbi:DNA polymerase III subunit epsilon [Futiania mangrovi]|uniref:DNA polymerase III subunit epsilon n=1 Tax=Futiania mangrovi TaxID=2959716 RepID=A0A9J6P9B0_9PROT|nr:DNA polymerase III subunit epsilon [Futiania mangrovii]MCP1336492.1 DNA polymerase III subunit epsilon [Futiania mangrovii]